MGTLHVSMALEQKISFSWSIFSVCLAVIISVVSTAIPTLRISKMLIPSFKGRWNPDDAQVKKGEYWETEMPMKITKLELDDFVNFVYKRMKDRKQQTKRSEGTNPRKSGNSYRSWL